MKNIHRVAGPALALLLAACAGSKSAGGRKASGGSAPLGAGTNALEPDAREMAALAVAELKPVAFRYDSAALDSDARLLLKANAAYLAAHKDLKIQVAGHCDERGTIAYNIALGQRRAREVRDFYRFLGVDGARVATISYGREKPLCAESNDACWARNRRAETLALKEATLAGAPLPRAAP